MAPTRAQEPYDECPHCGKYDLRTIEEYVYGNWVMYLGYGLYGIPAGGHWEEKVRRCYNCKYTEKIHE